MKTIFTSLVIGCAICVLVNNQATAASSAPAVEEDMAEGITLAVQQEKKNYAYDNSIASPEQNMSEFVVDSQVEQKEKKIDYECDPSVPSAEDLMTEGICYEEDEPLVATK